MAHSQQPQNHREFFVKDRPLYNFWDIISNPVTANDNILALQYALSPLTLRIDAEITEQYIEKQLLDAEKHRVIQAQLLNEINRQKEAAEAQEKAKKSMEQYIYDRLHEYERYRKALESNPDNSLRDLMKKLFGEMKDLINEKNKLEELNAKAEAKFNAKWNQVQQHQAGKVIATIQAAGLKNAKGKPILLSGKNPKALANLQKLKAAVAIASPLKIMRANPALVKIHLSKDEEALKTKDPSAAKKIVQHRKKERAKIMAKGANIFEQIRALRVAAEDDEKENTNINKGIVAALHENAELFMKRGKEAIEKAKEAVEDAATAVTETLTEAKDFIKDTATDLVEAFEEGIETAIDCIARDDKIKNINVQLADKSKEIDNTLGLIKKAQQGVERNDHLPRYNG